MTPGNPSLSGLPLREKTGTVRLGVLLSGRGSNFLAIADSIRERRLDAAIAVVLSNRAAAPGLEAARDLGFATAVVTQAEYPNRADHDRACVEILRRREVELVILAGYMRIVTPVLLSAFPNRVMNIHPALLPAFPGLDAQKQAWDYGVKISGCTVHLVTAGVDEGPIILQRAEPVEDDDDDHRLAERILVQEHRAYSEAISLYATGCLRLEGRRIRTAPKSAIRFDGSADRGA